jgi:hypothetical protein
MRRDNASNYLTDLIAIVRRLQGRWFGHMTLGLLGDPDVRRLLPPIDVNQNPSLRAAFEAFRLDPKNDAHRRLLLALFAEAYFVASRPRGGIEYWDSRKLCQLLADFAAVKKTNPDVSDGKICELVKKKFAKRYAGQSATTLRRKLQDARNPAKNWYLSSTLRRVPPADTRGMTTEQVRDYVIEQISKRWNSD